MPTPPLYDYTQFDFVNPLFGLEDVRSVNPHRFEMEQLSGVVYVDRENHGVVGFKDVSHDEFWARGHMPDFPIMPGVLLCESAAQLACFYSRKFDVLGGDYLGFGEMSDVCFRSPVLPGSRLILLVKTIRLKRGRFGRFDFQGFVNDRLSFEGSMIGVPICRVRSGS